MRKEAIGIAINGREVKIAHLFKDKDRMAIDFLQSAVLASDLEIQERNNNDDGLEATLNKDEVDAFDINGPYETELPQENEEETRNNANVLHTVLNKFAGRKSKVGFNISPSNVSYKELDTHLDYDKNVFQGTLREKIENWKKGFNALDTVSVLSRKDGTLCNVVCETPNPPILYILDQLNAYFKGNLFLALMDPNEISLVNLARNSYNFNTGLEITAIIEVETEFSRIIFMRGDDFLATSPIIPESVSPDINSIIYSKLLYELDNLNIEEVNNILLAGNASLNTTKEYFEKRLPKTRVGFIVSQPLAENLTIQYTREDLSQYAIPITLAWKAIDSKNDKFIPTNLLPAAVIDRQKVLKLSLTSYALLLLLAFTAFFMAWTIGAKNADINSFERQNIVLQDRIDNSEFTVKKVNDIDQQLMRLKKRLALSDSLGQGSDKLLSFLESLNESVLDIDDIWIEEVQTIEGGFRIQGMALKRGSVPELSETLGGAKIRKLTRSGYGSHKVFLFEMDIIWDPESLFDDYDQFPVPDIYPASRSSVSDAQYARAEIAQNRTKNLHTEPPQKSQTRADDSMSDRVSEATYSENQANDDNFQYGSYKKEATMREEESSASKAINYSTEPKRHRALSNDIEGAYSHYTIRISAHAVRFTAEKDIALFRSKGYEAYITRLPNSNRSVPYSVCFGNFDSYAEAQQECENLYSIIRREYDIVGLPDNKTSYAPQFNRNAPFKTTPVSDHRAIRTSSMPARQTRMADNGDDGNRAQAHRPSPDAEARKSINRIENSKNQESVARPHDSTSHYTIRISAHVIRFTADKDIKLFKSKGLETYLCDFSEKSPDSPYWVCYGKFDSVSSAEAEIAKLNRLISRKYRVIAVSE